MPARILQVAYDKGLLETRALMLTAKGYEVTSVLGNDAALAITPKTLSRFNLAVIGFSSTHQTRLSLVDRLKKASPKLPIVVLQYHQFEKFPQADCVTLFEDPERWLNAVAQCLSSE